MLPAILVLPHEGGEYIWDRRLVITAAGNHNLDLMVVVHSRHHYVPVWWGRDKECIRPHYLQGWPVDDLFPDTIPAYGELKASALLLARLGATPLGYCDTASVIGPITPLPTTHDEVANVLNVAQAAKGARLDAARRQHTETPQP